VSGIKKKFEKERGILPGKPKNSIRKKKNFPQKDKIHRTG
jgi:hypothetical protein